MAQVRLKNIVKRYADKQPVIHGVDLDIADGELVVLVGPSGCAKSTLLRMIAGLPATMFVAGFLGTPRMNFIAAEVAHADAATVRVRTPGGSLVEVSVNGSAVGPGDQVTLGVRAEHLAVLSGGQAGNQVAAEVRHVEYLGDQTIAYCAVAGSEALLALRQQADAGALQAGADILLDLPPRRCHLFDPSERSLAPL